MLSIALGVFAALYSGDLDVGARGELRAETRGGYLADGPTMAAGIDGELTPALTLSAHDGERLSLEGTYSPSLLVKSRNASATPLTLHVLRATAAHANRRGDALRLHISALSGPLDYDRAVRDLGSIGVLAAFPRGAMVSYSNADVVGAAIERLTRRLTVEADLSAGYTGPAIGDHVDIVRPQYRSSLQPGLAYAVTRRSTMGGAVQLSAVTFDRGPAYLGIAPAVSWAERLSARNTLRLRAGAQFTRTKLPSGARSTAVPNSIQAVATVGLDSTVPLSRRTTLTFRPSGELAPFYDPVHATLVPRAVGTLVAEIRLQRGPSAKLLAQWFEPLPARTSTEDRLAAAGLTFAAPLERGLRMEVGGVGLKRWDKTATGALPSSLPEMLAFVALAGELSLGRVEAEPGGAEP